MPLHLLITEFPIGPGGGGEKRREGGGKKGVPIA